jgi:alpha-tubulin suppressor-like RCC1 family protein
MRLPSIVTVLFAAAGSAQTPADTWTFAWGSMVLDSRWHERTDAVAVRATASNTAVLRADGTIAVVGDNTSGMGRVITPPPSTAFASFALNPGLGLALAADGTLVRWGESTTPNPKLSGVGYVALFGSFGPLHAVRSDGSVVNWGGAITGHAAPVGPIGVVEIASAAGFSVGRLANGGVTAWGNAPALPTLPPGVTCTRVTAGTGHVLLLRSDGAIDAIGSNIAGEGTVPPLPPAVTYSEVWACYRHCFARRSDGTIVAWGENQHGQTTLPPLPAGVDWIEFCGGIGFTSARTSDGRVRSWGNNRSGACNIPAAPAGVVYTEVSIAGDVALGVRSDGSLAHWGEATSYGLHQVPPLPGGVGYTRAFAGRNHCLALRSDGTLVGWGNNQLGQCVAPPLPPGTSWRKVALAYTTSLGLRSDGQIVLWGDLFAIASPPPLAAGTTWVDVVASRDHVLALRSDGLVAGWGDNAYGQATLPPLPPGRRFERIAVGENHSLVWRSDGVVQAFGDNSAGQRNVPVAAEWTYTAILGGGNVSGALHGGGGLVLWGSNQYAQRPVPALPSGVAYDWVVAGDSFLVARTADPRRYATYGPGCAGSAPVARLVPFAVPRLGQALRVELVNLPANTAVLITGTSSSTSAFGPLPLSGAALGMPGCTLWCRPDALELVAGSAQRATWTTTLPATPSLAGWQFFQQALVPDPAAGNALQAVLSDAASATIGS